MGLKTTNCFKIDQSSSNTMIYDIHMTLLRMAKLLILNIDTIISVVLHPSVHRCAV